jgi:hypothetical protein
MEAAREEQSHHVRDAHNQLAPLPRLLNGSNALGAPLLQGPRLLLLLLCFVLLAPECVRSLRRQLPPRLFKAQESKRRRFVDDGRGHYRYTSRNKQQQRRVCHCCRFKAAA